MKWRYKVEDAARAVAEFLQDRWFDQTRNVRTAGNVSLRGAGISPDETRDSELYVPARPANIRQALLETGITDFSGYTYVDLGSGKGRSLFIAADLPFDQIIGVEFSPLLHEQACANIRSFRWWRSRCARLTSLHMNAINFHFPPGKLVLYLFNPFGRETVGRVLNNLQRSLERDPRHVSIILLWPRCGDQVAALPGMQLRKATRRHEVFEFQPAAATASLGIAEPHPRRDGEEVRPE